MSVLLDTNILLRMANQLHPMHQPAKDAVSLLASMGVELVIVPQIVYEYWVVATRPVAVNGLGLTCSQAQLLD